MDNIKIAGDQSSPSVDFDFEKGLFSIKGMSYPEDARDFFNPLFDKLDSYFGELGTGEAVFTFEMQYFNSTSARAILHLFERFDEAAEAGASIRVVWRYDAEDDHMEEQGEEFGEDLEHASFELVAIEI